MPPKKFCDITGLEAPYRDPHTGLQYHSKEVYEVLKTLVSPYHPVFFSQKRIQSLSRKRLTPLLLSSQPRGADQQYLEIRGKASTIK